MLVNLELHFVLFEKLEGAVPDLHYSARESNILMCCLPWQKPLPQFRHLRPNLRVLWLGSTHTKMPPNCITLLTVVDVLTEVGVSKHSQQRSEKILR